MILTQNVIIQRRVLRSCHSLPLAVRLRRLKTSNMFLGEHCLLRCPVTCDFQIDATLDINVAHLRVDFASDDTGRCSNLDFSAEIEMITS